ncbi:MAG: hypothetical protein HY344_03200 [Candidatus Levybacteria bacterium]|nr:hypothetical protein [Candidatus Levybacteria bacterium]
MSKERIQRPNVIEFPREQFAIIGNNALRLDSVSLGSPKMAEVVDIRSHQAKKQSAEASAFKHEFYKGASKRQIEDDVASYLAEYRFEVPEFNYTLNIVDDDLIDPASGESMIAKAKKAIEEREKEGLSASREKAELRGLVSLKIQIKQNPNGTVVWFSPPGKEEEGYGRYGFGYVGKRIGDVLEMTAIRVEDPNIADFNAAATALWAAADLEKAEDFLESPRVVNIDHEKVKEFIHGNFEVKNFRAKHVFDRVRRNLRSVIREYASVAQGEDDERKHLALHVVENLSIELRQMYEKEFERGNVAFLLDQDIPTLETAMGYKKYIAPPPKIRGSCGSTGKVESNDIFRSIKSEVKKNISKQRDFEFNEPGPCRLCGRDVPCGPCFICERCNDSIDASEQATQAA